MRILNDSKLLTFLVITMLMSGFIPSEAEEPKRPETTGKHSEAKPVEKPEDAKLEPVTKVEPNTEDNSEEAETLDPDDPNAAEKAEAAAVAKPVTADLVQVYGWREKILIDGMKQTLNAKLDTGADTSSIHAEDKELFERDGKKWVRFIVTDPSVKDSPRVKIEAPLVRIARIKDPGGKTETREVVKLAFKIGDKKIRGDFTLNNRANMYSPVLIGRIVLKELGWVDSNRTNLADEKIMR